VLADATGASVPVAGAAGVASVAGVVGVGVAVGLLPPLKSVAYHPDPFS
jgi:hypothetical protein